MARFRHTRYAPPCLALLLVASSGTAFAETRLLDAQAERLADTQHGTRFTLRAELEPRPKPVGTAPLETATGASYHLHARLQSKTRTACTVGGIFADGFEG